jgi:uncharacterized membrane protein YdjX (TVP38/TMEM64 family)
MEQSAEFLNNSQRPMTAPDPATRNRAGAAVRLALIVAFFVAALLIVHFTPIRAWLGDANRLRANLAGLGFWVWPVSILAVAVLVSLGVPRLLLCAVGGMVFGFWIGLLITQIGSLLGHYAIFLFIRWAGRDWALHRWPRLHKWADLIHDHGIVGVFLVRQLPGHALLANLCLGLSHVKHRDFLIGTVLGLAPEAIPATLVGAGVVKASLLDTSGYLALAAAIVAMVWITCGCILRSVRKSRSDPVVDAVSLNAVTDVGENR